MIVATAGHIDHGKTTLVKALTGVDTDRLPEEKKRGISIDLGFAYTRTADGHAVAFVDVPGHERFVRNMLAGVCGIDYVMLVVAADDGVMPQTVEHLHIVDILGVRRGIAVITKCDRVNDARVAEVAEEVRTLLSSTGLAAIDVEHVCAATGDGVEVLHQTLATAARRHRRQWDAGRNLRYAIDRVFTVAGSGTVVTGTVFHGRVAVGDKLMLTPSGIEVRVRGIQKDGAPASQVVAGERGALNITGANVAQVQRGDWVVAPSIHAPTQRFDVRLHVLLGETQALKHWTPVHLHLGTADTTARVAIRRGESLAPGTSGVVQIVTDRPVATLQGDRFIVRDQSATRTLGGGIVLDPFARPARRGAPCRAAALDRADPEAALAALIACVPGGVDLADFERALNLTPERGAMLAGNAEVVVLGKKLRTALLPAAVASARHGVLDALARFHRESPQAVGIDVALLRKVVAPEWPTDAFHALLQELVDRKSIEVAGAQARLPAHVATGNAADEKIWQVVQPILDDAGLKPPKLSELAARAGIKEALLKDFLHRKARTYEVIRVTAERFYPRATLAGLGSLAQDLANACPDGRISVAQFRDASGIGRGLAIEILECLDRLGITRRVGDSRVAGKDVGSVLGSITTPLLPRGPVLLADIKPRPARVPHAIKR